MTAVVNHLFFQRDTLTGRVIHSALSVDLGQALARDRPTVIYADTIKASGTVSSSAHGIELYCRLLVADNNALIDTSGANGTPSHAPDKPPHSAGYPGKSGDDGGPGGTGGHAGPVSIVAQQITGTLRIRAVGGCGGRGQDGEDGFTGEVGADGRNDLQTKKFDAGTNLPDVDPAGDAGPGGRGGNGGKAGLSGSGGSGGNVTVSTRVPLSPGQVTVANDGGPPGDMAKPGSSGRGGDPGNPGSQWMSACEDIDGRQRCSLVQPKTVGRRARPGPWGDSFPAIPASAGAKGQPAMPTRTLAATEMAPSFKGTLLEMLCWKAEDDFRQGGGVLGAAFVERLNFLVEICAADPAPDAGKKAILGKTYTLKRKGEMGLDFYGYSLEDAPLLSYQTYSDLIGNDLFGQLAVVENHYRQALDQAQSAEKRREAIEFAIGEADKTIRQLAQAADASGVMAQDLSKTIDRLQATVDQARAVLENARRALEDAIRSGAGQSCDLVTVLTAAMAIYASYQSGVAVFGPMTGAMDKIVTYLVFDDTVKKLFDDRAVFEKQLKTIEGGFASLQQAMNKIGAEVDALTPAQRTLPSLQMQKQHFDKIADQFAGFAASAGYKEAGYAYLKAVEARNQTIVDYNAALLRLLQLQAQLVAGRQGLDSLRARLTGEYDPAQTMVFTLLTGIYRDTLSFAGAYVHAERKALAYALNQPAIAPLSELNASTLIDAHSQTLDTWVRAKAKFEVDRSTREFLIDLRDFADPDAQGAGDAPQGAWALFKATGKLVFFLRRDHEKYRHRFEHLPGLRLKSAELLLQGVMVRPGASLQDGELFWKLRQSGHEEVYRPDGTMVRFRHNSVRVDGSIALGGGDGIKEPSFTENGRYFGLSPFSCWNLTIDEFDQFDFSGLAGAQLRVSGSYVQDGEHE